MTDIKIVQDALNAATFPDQHASGSHMRATALLALDRLSEEIPDDDAEKDRHDV